MVNSYAQDNRFQKGVDEDLSLTGSTGICTNTDDIQIFINKPAVNMKSVLL